MDSVIIHRRNIFLLRLFCVLMLFMLTTAGVDYYAILGVSKNADNRDLAKAYRNLAVKWHPDKHSENKGLAAEKFMEIRESYDFLKDPVIILTSLMHLLFITKIRLPYFS